MNSFCTTSSKIKLMIATSVFGLGVDIPGEEYEQETGHAGRNGLPAIAFLHEGKSGRFVNKK